MEHPTGRASKTQKESHSEIERKRRERMKRDTEFLRKQISNSQCKDKLSTFQAGAEQLIQYTDTLGKREYIINDQEYSRLIMSDFGGFDIHIRCSDCKILRIHKNVEKILDLREEDVVGRSLYEIVEPSPSTSRIINDAFRGSDAQWDIFKGLVARNFILAVRCGPNIHVNHCVYGSDGGVYRFIEFCGDLSNQTENEESNASGVTFRGLCRPLDPASATVSVHPDDPNKSAGTGIRKHFTLRICPKSLRITEAIGECKTLIGVHPDCLVHKQLNDFVIPAEQERVNYFLNESQLRNTCTSLLHLLHSESGQALPFDARFTAIRLGQYLHCIVCRLESICSAPGSVHVNPATQNMKPGIRIECGGDGCVARERHQLTDPKPASNSSEVDSSSFCSVQIKQEPPMPSINGNLSLIAEPIPVSSCPPPRSDYVDRLDVSGDEWFHNVDTSGFKQLLNDSSIPLTPEGFMGMLQSSDSSPES